MMKRVFVFLLLCLILCTGCGKQDTQDPFGTCIFSGAYDELTDPEYTAYLQTAYGLDQLTDHRVYHQNGTFQVDFNFTMDVPQWQLDSAKLFAHEKFYERNPAKYDIHHYDLWIIENLQEDVHSVTYRIFIDGKLQDSGLTA